MFQDFKCITRSLLNCLSLGEVTGNNEHITHSMASCSTRKQTENHDMGLSTGKLAQQRVLKPGRPTFGST
jgi:hypothetical protein